MIIILSTWTFAGHLYSCLTLKIALKKVINHSNHIRINSNAEKVAVLDYETVRNTNRWLQLVAKSRQPATPVQVVTLSRLLLDPPRIITCHSLKLISCLQVLIHLLLYLHSPTSDITSTWLMINYQKSLYVTSQSIKSHPNNGVAVSISRRRS